MQSAKLSNAFADAGRCDLPPRDAHVLMALEEERRRIARELHDDFGQRFGVIQFQLADMLARSKSRPVSERKLLEQISDSIHSLAEDIARIGHQLHPYILSALGLAGALDVHVVQFCRQAGLESDFRTKNVPREIPAATAGALFRITQEALHNAAKHARGSTVTVRLEGTDSELMLSIRDNGPGFDHARALEPAHLGLKSMEERARLVGGRFRLDAAPGRGVAILVAAPLA